MGLFKILVAVVILAAASVAMACGGSDDGQKAADSVPSGSDGTDITLKLVAKNLQFDKNQLKAPAEKTVTLILENQDVGVTHNIAVYESEDAKDKIFAVPVVTGPDHSTGEFKTPKAGDYFFRCDAHPDTMTGTLTVG